MGRRSIEVVRLLVDQIHQGGYQHRVLEDSIYEEKQKRIAVEKDRDHWMAARKDAITAGELMQAEIERLRQQLSADAVRQELEELKAKNLELLAKLATVENAAANENESLRQKLTAAEAAVSLQRSGIERLNAFVGKVRSVIDNDCDGLEIDEMIEALDELDDETTPATEPAPCPECERFRVLVSKMHLIVDDSRASNGVRINRIKDALAEFHVESALAEIQSNSSPVKDSLTPATEGELSEEMQDAVPPTWAPLVWDLRRRLRESQQELTRERLDAEARGHELERLRAFVSEVRSVVESEWYGLEMATIRQLLSQLDSRTFKPTPATEAEGGA